MDDVRGLFLGMPHGTTPAAVTTNKNKIMSSFKSSGDILCFLISQNISADLKGPKVKYKLHYALCGFCLERFPLPPGAWDGLRYFIVALPESFI